MASGRRTLLIAGLVAAVAAGGGFAAAQFVVSPAQVAAQSKPPAAEPITVPVEKTELKAAVTARGDVGYAGAVKVSVPAGEAVQVVTGLPKKAGDSIEAADVLIEISGRPVIALPGSVPGYRTLSHGSKGPDVEQLQQALTTTGHYDGPIDGTYGRKVAAAVAALYKSLDYSPPTAGPEAAAALDQAKLALSDAQQQLADAETAHDEASKGPKKSEALAAQAAVDAAAADLENARNTPTEPDQHAVTTAQRALDKANGEVQQAQQAVTEAEQALALAQGNGADQGADAADRPEQANQPEQASRQDNADSGSPDVSAPHTTPLSTPTPTPSTPVPSISPPRPSDSGSGDSFLEPAAASNPSTDPASTPSSNPNPNPKSNPKSNPNPTTDGLGLRGPQGWSVPRAAPDTDNAAAVQAAQQELDRRKAELDQAKAAAETAEQALEAAETPSEPDPAAIKRAQGQLDVAIAQRDELLAGPDTDATAAAVTSAKKRLAAARAELAKATDQASTPLPSAEVMFLADLPRRVASVEVKAGDPVDGAVMTVSGSGLQVTATVSDDQAELLDKGMTASLAAAGVDPVSGVITAIEPGDEGVVVTLEPRRLTDDQTKALAGTNVKVVIDIGSTAGKVLAVPVAALFSQPDGSTEVEIGEPDGAGKTGDTRFQRVRTGLAADGLVEVVPQSETGDDVAEGSTTLQPGDLVVVGR